MPVQTKKRKAKTKTEQPATEPVETEDASVAVAEPEPAPAVNLADLVKADSQVSESQLIELFQVDREAVQRSIDAGKRGAPHALSGTFADGEYQFRGEVALQFLQRHPHTVTPKCIDHFNGLQKASVSTNDIGSALAAHRREQAERLEIERRKALENRDKLLSDYRRLLTDENPTPEAVGQLVEVAEELGFEQADIDTHVSAVRVVRESHADRIDADVQATERQAAFDKMQATKLEAKRMLDRAEAEYQAVTSRHQRSGFATQRLEGMLQRFPWMLDGSLNFQG